MFVLGLPLELSASEVIARAKAAGMQLTTNYVYKIRSRGAPNGKASGRFLGADGTSFRAAIGRSSDRTDGLEQRFTALVLDLGLSRASALMDRVRSQVKTLAL